MNILNARGGRAFCVFCWVFAVSPLLVAAEQNCFVVLKNDIPKDRNINAKLNQLRQVIDGNGIKTVKVVVSSKSTDIELQLPESLPMERAEKALLQCDLVDKFCDINAASLVLKRGEVLFESNSIAKLDFKYLFGGSKQRIVKFDKKPSTGEVVVKYFDWLALDSSVENARSNAYSRLQGLVKSTSRVGELTDKLELSSTADPNLVVDMLRSSSDIEIVQPNYIYSAAAGVSDPSFPFQGTLSRMYVPQAWDILTNASWVKVAVLDTGITSSHPDLAANLWQNPSVGAFFSYPGLGGGNEGSRGINIARFNSTIDPYASTDTEDYNRSFKNGDNTYRKAHGTLVAGIIGMVPNNGFGGAGIAWNVSLMAVKIMGNGAGTFTPRTTSIQIAAGIEYARTHGAHIVNLSIDSSVDGLYDPVVGSKIKEAGIPVVIAAGNGAVDIDNLANFPDTSFTAPAGEGYRNMIVVTGSDGVANQPNNIPFAYGRWKVDVAAPGVNVFSVAKDPDYGDWIFANNCTGTSFAAAEVSGILALAKARFPSESSDRLISRVRNSCDFTTSSKPTMSGGVVNAYRVLNDQPRLMNLSSQCIVGGDAGVATLGFEIRDSAKRVLIRGIGPTLAALNVQGPLMSDPFLTLYNQGGSVITTNDSYLTLPAQDSTWAYSIWNTLSQSEAAIVVTLNPGVYTATLSSKVGRGRGLIEIYEDPNVTGRFANLSIQCFSGLGSEGATCGISTTEPAGSVGTYAIRAWGKGLSAVGVPGVVQNVSATLYRNGLPSVTNIDSSSLPLMVKRLQECGISPHDSTDAAFIERIPAGGASVNVQSQTGQGGRILIDLFEY